MIDLYEIVVSAEVDRVRARIEKYSVKQTQLNFLPLRLTVEQEGQGYSHRLTSRVSIDQLMRVQRIGSENCTYVYRSIYCFEHQREQAFKLVVQSVGDRVKTQQIDATRLHAQWCEEIDQLKLEELPRRVKAVATRSDNR